MRDLHELDRYRLKSKDVLDMYGGFGDGSWGVFQVPSPIDGATIGVVASSGAGWEHVSASRNNRYPNWPEMDLIKRLFFLPEETAVQFHVTEHDEIREHPYCLHLWRPLHIEMPSPPFWMIGGCSPEEAKKHLAEALAKEKKTAN